MTISTPFTYGSVCSGIEAVSVAWQDLPLNALWLSEIAPFPCALLTQRWPAIANLGDMTLLADRVLNGEVAAPDILVGGTPCQSFSVAGMRRGLTDPRGQLSLAFIRLADAVDEKRREENKHAALILWENVPGALSDAGNAFGHFIAGLAGAATALTPAPTPRSKKSTRFWRWSAKRHQHIPRWPRAGCVYGARRSVAWRVLDARYFGLAQRRKRLFVIAGAGAGFDPARILFECESLRGDIAAGCRPESPPAPVAVSGVAGPMPVAFNRQGIGAYSEEDIAGTCASCDYKDARDLVVFPVTCIASNTLNRTPYKGGHHLGLTAELCYTLNTSHAAHAVIDGYTVRRLLPVEYERLQGFPDNYTRISWRGKTPENCPDGPRYQALGNAMPVPVIRWLGKRIVNYLTSLQAGVPVLQPDG